MVVQIQKRASGLPKTFQEKEYSLYTGTVDRGYEKVTKTCGGREGERGRQRKWGREGKQKEMERESERGRMWGRRSCRKSITVPMRRYGNRSVLHEVDSF
jgi:hypothetical protein